MMDMRTRKRVANYLGHKNSHRMIKPVLFADNCFLGAIGEDGGMRVWSAALAGPCISEQQIEGTARTLAFEGWDSGLLTPPYHRVWMGAETGICLASYNVGHDVRTKLNYRDSQYSSR